MTSEPRIVGLDGLRALAIGLVLADHAVGGGFAGGGIGVSIFFVLSGYLITSLLSAEYAANSELRLWLFYARRALRLWPALLAMLAATVALGSSVKSAAVAGTYLTDIANVFGYDVYPYGHTWSLGVEEQFYIVWPLILLVLVRISVRKQAYVLTIATAFSAVGCAVWTYQEVVTTGAVGLGVFNPLWQGHGLLLGCLLALVGRERRCRRPGTVIILATVAQLATAMTGSILVAYHVALVWNLLAEFVAVIMIVCLRDTSVSIYTWKPVVWMGQRSYAIYLWHLPLISLLGSRGLPYAPMVGVLLSFGTAELSARYVEAPFLRLKDQLHPKNRGSVPA